MIEANPAGRPFITHIGLSLNERIPDNVQPLLNDYLSLIDQRLPGLVAAFYVIGSIALGEFNEHFSDLDFIAVLRRKAVPSDIENLRQIHQQIEKTYPRWPMSGSYLQVEALGRLDEEVEAHPYYHDGHLFEAGQSGLNSVTWWELKNHGIAVIGPEPKTYAFSVDWDVLIANMHDNLNSYWASWAKRPGRIVQLFSDWGIQWAVLGVLRQFYTFRENDITTKRKAGEYALTCVPARWHRLIREAIDIRDGKGKPFHPLRVGRTIEAIQFLRFVIRNQQEANPK